MIEAAMVLEAVEQRGHPPGEALRFPNAPQADTRVAFERQGGALLIEAFECLDQNRDIGHRQVHSLSPGGWNDVGGVSSKKQLAKLHGLNDEATHSRDALLQDGSAVWLPSVCAVKAQKELVPDTLIGPLRQVLVWLRLEVEARKFWRAHAEQCEAAVMVHVDELVGGGRSFDENTQPSKWIDAFKRLQNTWGNGGAADAVKAIASRDIVGDQFMALAGLLEMYRRNRALEILDAESGAVEPHVAAAGYSLGNQVFDDLMLAVDGYTFPTRELGHGNAVALPMEANLDAVVEESFPFEAVSHTGLPEHVHRALLEYARANAFLAMLPRAQFDDHRVDAMQV